VRRSREHHRAALRAVTASKVDEMIAELARVLRDRGFDAQAEPLIRESLAIRRKLFGEADRDRRERQRSRPVGQGEG
jgi:hypothetical protein